MKIERDEEGSNDLALRDGISVLVHGRPAPRSTEEQLLLDRDSRRRRARTHLNVYVSVIGGLSIINILGWLLSGTSAPWVLYPAVLWGIGVAIHILGYRGWLADHGAPIVHAEQALGSLSASAPAAALADVSGRGKGYLTTAWGEIVRQSRNAVERAEAALLALEHPAQDIDSTHADLQEGLERIEHLAEGADRMRRALDTIAPGGLEALDAQIAQEDVRISETADESLRAARHENRALLVARRAKIEKLIAEEKRMLANAQGFLLATENLFLDTAQLDLDANDSSVRLSTPIQRLNEEVDLLRKVEAEIKRL